MWRTSASSDFCCEDGVPRLVSLCFRNASLTYLGIDTVALIGWCWHIRNIPTIH